MVVKKKPRIAHANNIALTDIDNSDMTPQDKIDYLRYLGLTENLARMTWVLRLNGQTELTNQMLYHGDERRIMVHVIRKMRDDMNRFMLELEQKAIDYK